MEVGPLVVWWQAVVWLQVESSWLQVAVELHTVAEHLEVLVPQLEATLCP